MNPSDPQRPRSLLFLSCDIVGSTSFKQQKDSLWQRTFLSFYREFPQTLGEVTRRRGEELKLVLWKPVGDELIFTTEVRSEHDVYRAVRVWLDAMDEYETESLGDVNLSTKGGAFIATFPGPDSESSIPIDPQSEQSDKGVVELNDEALANRQPEKYLYDFFGPSIDTGFRVLGHCSQRHFTLSVEVVWAMAQCRLGPGVGQTRFPIDDLRLLETKELKGVWKGRQYPLFAIDRHAEDLVNVALGQLRKESLDPQEVSDLCYECCILPEWPSRVYFPDSEHGYFKDPVTDSLAGLRTNSMDGAETVIVEDSGEKLPEYVPLGDVD